MEAAIYRLRQDQKDPELKRHVRRCIGLYCAGLIAGFFVIGMQARPGSMSDVNGLLFALGIETVLMVGIATWHVGKIRKLLETVYASAQTSVTDQSITSHRDGRHDIMLQFGQIVAIEEKPGNGMLLRGRSAAERIWIAEETESFPQLRQFILQRTSVTPKDTSGFWGNPIFISLILVAAWVAFSVLTGWISMLFGIVAVCIMVGQFFWVIRNPNNTGFTRKLIWLNLFVAMSILLKMANRR